MKTIFRTAGAILAAGAILTACGQSSPAKSKVTTPAKAKTAAVVKPGWYGVVSPVTHLQKLRLPYGGNATPTITKWASTHYAFYAQLIKPKDWVKSKTFGQYIFVGPYGKGKAYQQIRDAKIGAVDGRELAMLLASRSTTPPSTLTGFNYRTYGQWPVASPTTLSTLSSQLTARYGATTTLTASVPSVATIIESPVGLVTGAEAADSNPPTPGVCVPHELALLKGTQPVLSAPLNNLRAFYSVQYTSTSLNVVESSGGVQEAGTCAF